MSENNECSWCGVTQQTYSCLHPTFIHSYPKAPHRSPKNTLLCLNTRHWSKGQCNSIDATSAYSFSPYLFPSLFYIISLFRLLIWNVMFRKYRFCQNFFKRRTRMILFAIFMFFLVNENWNQSWTVAVHLSSFKHNQSECYILI